MWIGELAHASGTTPETIRYYERIGLLPEPDRSAGGFRLYGPDDIDRLGFVGRAQSLGLSLEEVGEVLRLVDSGAEPCEHVGARLRTRLGEVEERIAELTGLRDRLEGALAVAEEVPATGECRCRIIDRSTKRARPARSSDG